MADSHSGESQIILLEPQHLEPMQRILEKANENCIPHGSNFTLILATLSSLIPDCNQAGVINPLEYYTSHTNFLLDSKIIIIDPNIFIDFGMKLVTDKVTELQLLLRYKHRHQRSRDIVQYGLWLQYQENTLNKSLGLAVFQQNSEIINNQRIFFRKENRALFEYYNISEDYLGQQKIKLFKISDTEKSEVLNRISKKLIDEQVLLKQEKL